MQGLIDKSADDVWLSVTTVHSEQGVVETRPRNDEEWLKHIDLSMNGEGPEISYSDVTMTQWEPQERTY